MTSDVTFNELDALDAELLPERTVLSSVVAQTGGTGDGLVDSLLGNIKI